MAKTAAPADSSVLNDLKALQGRVVERIRELEPFMEELRTLREQAERMGIDLTEEPAKPRRAASSRGSRKTTASRAKRTAAKPARRRRRSGNGESRADQVLRLVHEQPGISASALGIAMGVDSTGLYRVIRQLEGEGRVRKQGREVHPVEQHDAAGTEVTPDDQPVGAEA